MTKHPRQMIKPKLMEKTDAKSVIEIDNKNEAKDPTKAGETNEKNRQENRRKSR